MTNQPESQQTSQPVSDFKKITSTTKAVTDELIRVIPEFKKAGIQISLIASGVIIAILIIVLSFFSGKGGESSIFVGITIWEELLFMIISIAFVVSGVLHSIKYNSDRRQIIEMRMKLDQAEMQMNFDLQQFIHEEAMEKIKGTNQIIHDETMERIKRANLKTSSKKQEGPEAVVASPDGTNENGLAT